MNKNIETEKWINPIAISVFFVIIAFDGLLFYLRFFHPSVAVAGAFLALFVAASIKIADQWEKAVVLRLGKFKGLKGPGLFLSYPLLISSPGTLISVCGCMILMPKKR
jgi:hypothetical protein